MMGIIVYVCMCCERFTSVEKSKQEDTMKSTNAEKTEQSKQEDKLADTPTRLKKPYRWSTNTSKAVLALLWLHISVFGLTIALYLMKIDALYATAYANVVGNIAILNETYTKKAWIDTFVQPLQKSLVFVYITYLITGMMVMSYMILFLADAVQQISLAYKDLKLCFYTSWIGLILVTATAFFASDMALSDLHAQDFSHQKIVYTAFDDVVLSLEITRVASVVFNLLLFATGITIYNCLDGTQAYFI